MNYNITLLPGDGIGPEIIDASKRVLLYAANKFNIKLNLKEELIGGSSIDQFGIPLTKETLTSCLNADAVILGAVGGHKWDNLENANKPETALLKLRKELGLYTNIRPAKAYKALLNNSSLKNEIINGVDFIVFRELTGGIYFGEPRELNEESAFNTMVYEKTEIERIARQAFKSASTRKKHLTNVHKANVLEVSQLWKRIVEDIRKNEFPEIELTNMYIDNAAMQMIKGPNQFDVILTSNLFGDILSDISGMITGSLGMLPSASLGNKHSLYEPIHGSAPDISNQNIANPIGAIASVAMMFEHSFKMTKTAEIIYSSIERTLDAGYRTPDIADEYSKVIGTSEIASKIIENFENIFNEQAIGVFTL